MGVLVLTTSIILTVILVCAAMIYAGGGQFVLGGVLLVLSILVMFVGGKIYRAIRLAKDAKFFEANPNASIVRIMHKPKRELIYLYTQGDTPLATTPECTLFASKIYLTYGIKEGTHTINASYSNQRDFSLKPVEKTITLDILPNKFYELRYNKKDESYSLQEAELPKDLKRYQPFLQK